MKFKLFEKLTSNLRGENKLLKFVVVVIGCVELYNTHQINKAMKYQRTVLVPVGLDQRVTLVGDRASEEYLRIFARNVSNLAFNYNTASARGQFGELLQFFSPETFPAAKTEFYSIADTIERTRVSSSFVISKPTEVDSEKQTITVAGVQRQWVDSNFIDTAEKVYQISFKLLDGRFMVTGITEKQHGPAASKPNEAQAQASGTSTGGVR